METPENTTARASKRRCLRREKEADVSTPQNEISPRVFFPSSFPSPAARSSASHGSSSIAKGSSPNADCAIIADRNEATLKTTTPPDKSAFPSTPRHAADAADMAKQQFALMRSLGDTSQRPHALVDALQEATDIALQTGGRQAELVAFAHNALNVMKNGNPGRIETTTDAGTHFASCAPASLVPQHGSILELLRQRRSVSGGSESCRGPSMLPDNEGGKSQETSSCKEQTLEGMDSLRARGEAPQANWTAPFEAAAHHDNAAKGRHFESLRGSVLPREAVAQNYRDVQRFGPPVQSANTWRHPSFEQSARRTHGTPGRNDSSAAPAAFHPSVSGAPHRRADPSVAAFAPLICPLPGAVSAGLRIGASRPGPETSSSEFILQTLRALMSFNTLQTAAAAPSDFSASTAHSDNDLSSPSGERLNALLCPINAPAVTSNSSPAGAGTAPVPEPVCEFQKAEISPHTFEGAMQPAAQHLLYSLLMSCGTDHHGQMLEDRDELFRGPSAARSPGPDVRQHTSLPATQNVFTRQSQPRPTAQCLTYTPPRVLSPPSTGGPGDYENLSSPAEQRRGSRIAAQTLGQSLPEDYPKHLESVASGGSICSMSGLAKRGHNGELCHSSEDATQTTPTHSSYGSIRKRGPRLTADKHASPPGLRGATGELTGVSRDRSHTESLTRGDSMDRTDSLARTQSTGKGAGRARGRYAATAAGGSPAPSSLGRGLASTAGGGGADCNQEDKTGKPDVTLGGNRPHYHVAKQEWRVRYYLNGKRKMRTYSAKFYGYDAAHSMATDFAQYVDKNEALPHPVCKPVGLGGSRGAAYSSVVAGRAVPGAAVVRERDEQSDIAVETRYAARHQQLMGQQPPSLPSHDPGAGASATKGLDVLRLACAAAGTAANFPSQQTHVAAARGAAGGVDGFSVDGESSPGVTRMSGLSRTSTRVLQTSATPSEEENSPYYEHSLSSKVELDRESSSSGSHSHELHEDPVLQQEYSCMADQQTATPSSLSAADYVADTKLAAFLKSRKRRSSALCCAEERPSAPASLPGLTVPGGTATAGGDGGNEDGSLKSVRLDMTFYASPPPTAVTHSAIEHQHDSGGMRGAIREATADRIETGALFGGMQEKEKLYLSKLFSSVWLPPACSKHSSEVSAPQDSHDNNSTRSTSNYVSSALVKLNDVAGTGSRVQENLPLSQRQESGRSSLQINASLKSAVGESKTPSLSLCGATAYKNLPTAPGGHQKMLACSLAAALLRTQVNNIPSEAAGSRGKGEIEEETSWIGENRGSSSCSSIDRPASSWTNIRDGGRENTWARAAHAPTAEKVTIPTAVSRTQTISGAVGGESKRIVSMAPGHATAAMLAKTAVSQQMLDTVTLFDEFIRGFENEFSAEHLHQQRNALLRPAACLSPEVCASLSALERRNLETEDSVEHPRDHDPARGVSPGVPLLHTKEDTQTSRTRPFSDCYSMFKSTKSLACLSEASYSVAGVVSKEKLSPLHASMPLLHPSHRFPVRVGDSPISMGGVAAGLRLRVGSSELLVLSRVLVELTSSTYVLVTTLKATLANSTNIVQKHYEKLPATFTHETPKFPNSMSKDAVRRQRIETESGFTRKIPPVPLTESMIKGSRCGSPTTVVQHGTTFAIRQHYAAVKQQEQQDTLAELRSKAENITRCSDASVGGGNQMPSAENCTQCGTKKAGLNEMLDAEAANQEQSAEQLHATPEIQHRIRTTEQTPAPARSVSEARERSMEKGEKTIEGCGSRQRLLSDTPYDKTSVDKDVCFEGQPSLHTTAGAKGNDNRLVTSTAAIPSSSAERGGSTREQDAKCISLSECGDNGEIVVEDMLRERSLNEHTTSGTAYYGVQQRVVVSSHNTEKLITGDIEQSPGKTEGRKLRHRVPERLQGSSLAGVHVAEQQQQAASRDPALAERTASESNICVTHQGVQEEAQRQRTVNLQHLQHHAEQSPCFHEIPQKQGRQLWTTRAENLPATSGGSCTCTKSGVVLHNILTLLQSQQRLVSVISQLQLSVPQYLRLIIRVAGHCFLPYKLPPATYFQVSSQPGPEKGVARGTATPACAPSVGSATSSGGTSAPVTSSASAGEGHFQHLGQKFLKAHSCCLRDEPEALLTRSCGSVAMGRSAAESCRVFADAEEKGVEGKETIEKDLNQQQDAELPCPTLSEKMTSFSSFSRQSSSVVGFASCGAVTSASSTELEYSVTEPTALLTGDPEKKLSRDTVEEEMTPSKTRENFPKGARSREEEDDGKRWEVVGRDFRVASTADSAVHSAADRQQVKVATTSESNTSREANVINSPVTDSSQETSCGGSVHSTTAASAWGVGSYNERTRMPCAEVSGGRIIEDEAALEVFLLRPFQPVVCSCQERPCPCDRQHIADLIHMLYTLPKPCEGTAPASIVTPAPGEAFLPNAAASTATEQTSEFSLRAAAVPSNGAEGDSAQPDAAEQDLEAPNAERAKKAAAQAAIRVKEPSGAVVHLPECASRPQSVPVLCASPTLTGAREAHPANVSSNNKARFRSHSGIASSRTTSSGSSSSSLEPSTIGVDALVLVEESLKQMLFAKNATQNDNGHTSYNHALPSVSDSPLCGSQTTGTPHTLLSAAGTPGTASSCATSPFQRSLTATAVPASCLLREASRQSMAQTFAEEKRPTNRDSKPAEEKRTATPKEEDQTEDLISSTVSPGVLKKAAMYPVPLESEGGASCPSGPSVTGLLHRGAHLQESKRDVHAEGDSSAATHSPLSHLGENLLILEETQLLNGGLNGRPDTREIQRRVSEADTCGNSSTEAAADRKLLQKDDSGRGGAAADQSIALLKQSPQPESMTVAIVEGDEKEAEVCDTEWEDPLLRREDLNKDAFFLKKEKANALRSALVVGTEAVSAAGANPVEGSLEEDRGRTTILDGRTSREDQQLQAGHPSVSNEGKIHGAMSGSRKADENLTHLTAAETAEESRNAGDTQGQNDACGGETVAMINILTFNNERSESHHQKHGEAVVAALGAIPSQEDSCCVDAAVRRSEETKQESPGNLSCWRETRQLPEENHAQAIFLEREQVVSGTAQRLDHPERIADCRGLGAGAAVEDREKGREQRKHSLFQEIQPAPLAEKSAASLDSSYPTMLASILPLQSLAHTIARLIVHLHRQLICRYVTAHVDVLVDTSTDHSTANFAPTVLQRLVQQLTDGETKCLSSSCSSLWDRGSIASTTTNSSNNGCRSTYSRGSSSEEHPSNSSNRGVHEIVYTLPDRAFATAKASARLSRSDGFQKGGAVEEALAAAAEIFAGSSATGLSRTIISGEDQAECLNKKNEAATFGRPGAEAPASMQHSLHERRVAPVNTVFCSSGSPKGVNRATEGVTEEAADVCMETTTVYCLSPFGTKPIEATPKDLETSALHRCLPPNGDAIAAAATRKTRPDSWNSNQKDEEDLEDRAATREAVSYADMLRAAAAAVSASTATPGPETLLSVPSRDGYVHSTAGPAGLQRTPFATSSQSGAEKCSTPFPLCTSDARNKRGFHPLSSSDILERVAALTGSLAGCTVEDALEKVSDCKAAEISQFLARAQAFYAACDAGDKSAAATAHSSRTEDTQGNKVAHPPRKESGSTLLAFSTSAEATSSNSGSCLY